MVGIAKNHHHAILADKTVQWAAGSDRREARHHAAGEHSLRRHPAAKFSANSETFCRGIDGSGPPQILCRRAPVLALGWLPNGV